MTDSDIERNQRLKLYNRLIVKGNKPCSNCLSLVDRRIHRIIPGKDGGKYTLKNVEVLCETCHLALHNQSKFKLGTKVVINGRCPQYLLEGVRHNRARTITSIFYNYKLQANVYYLGSNNTGSNSDFISQYPFRSYQLRIVTGRGVGRPRTKRRYTLRRKRTDSPSDGCTAIKTGQPYQLDMATLNMELVKGVVNKRR